MSSTGFRPRRGALRPDAVLRAAIVAVFAAMLLSGVAFCCFGIDALALSLPLPLCPFRAITGIPCPGCGMTHAFLLLSQLRVGEALAANAAAPLLLAAMLWGMLRRRPGGRSRTFMNSPG